MENDLSENESNQIYESQSDSNEQTISNESVIPSSTDTSNLNTSTGVVPPLDTTTSHLSLPIPSHNVSTSSTSMINTEPNRRVSTATDPIAENNQYANENLENEPNQRRKVAHGRRRHYS